MRLKNVETGHNAIQKQKFEVIKAHLGGRVPDPIRTFSYRRDFFGKHFATCYHEAMRSSSEWRIGEVELFAAFVSKQNQCKYWINHHTAVAVLDYDEAVVAAILEDWRTAPIDDKLRSVLAFLEKLTVSPAEVSPSDIERMRSAGVSDQAIADATYVCFIYSVLDRLADTLDFKLGSQEETKKIAQFLFQAGYAGASVPDTA